MNPDAKPIESKTKVRPMSQNTVLYLVSMGIWSLLEVFRDLVSLIFLVNKIISKNDIVKTKIAKLEKNICNLRVSSWLKFSLGIRPQ